MKYSLILLATTLSVAACSRGNPGDNSDTVRKPAIPTSSSGFWDCKMQIPKESLEIVPLDQLRKLSGYYLSCVDGTPEELAAQIKVYEERVRRGDSEAAKNLSLLYKYRPNKSGKEKDRKLSIFYASEMIRLGDNSGYEIIEDWKSDDVKTK